MSLRDEATGEAVERLNTHDHAAIRSAPKVRHTAACASLHRVASLLTESRRASSPALT